MLGNQTPTGTGLRQPHGGKEVKARWRHHLSVLGKQYFGNLGTIEPQQLPLLKEF